MARKIARLVGQFYDIPPFTSAPIRRDEHVLAMLRAHRAWMFWGIERLNCGHPDLTKRGMQRMRKCMAPRTALTRRTSREPASKSPMLIKSEISATPSADKKRVRSEEHTSELQSPDHLVCRLLLEKKKIHRH